MGVRDKGHLTLCTFSAKLKTGIICFIRKVKKGKVHTVEPTLIKEQVIITSKSIKVQLSSIKVSVSVLKKNHHDETRDRRHHDYDAIGERVVT